MKRPLTAAVGLVVLLGAAVGLQAARDRAYGEREPVENVLYIRSAEFLERASLSHASLVADVYWIRTIQYYGNTRLGRTREKRYDLLYPLLDIVTTLDPRMKIAYRFGSVFLAEKPPGGPGRPDLAIRLLEKGKAADPTRWEYDLDRGFVYYWFLRDYRKAAEAFERGGRIAGGPGWLRMMAALVLGHGGDRRGSRTLWQQLYETADNEWLRSTARLRLAQLNALDEIDRLQALVAAVSRRTGEQPTSWHALVRAGWLRAAPLDPDGKPYVLDPATGRVTVSIDSRMHPLPTEPAPWSAPPPS